MSNNYVISGAPLPTDWSGTPQEFYTAMLARMKLVAQGSSFVESETMPTSNQGPWLKNGRQWYIWDATAHPPTYIPQDLSYLTQQIWVGDTVPDPTIYKVWVETDGSSLKAWHFYMGLIAGWVGFDSVLQNGAITHEMLAVNSVYRENIASGEVTIDKLANDLPFTHWRQGAAGQYLRMNSDGSALGYGTLLKASPGMVWSTGAWTSWDHGFGVTPNIVRAVLVCNATDGIDGYEMHDEVSMPSGADSTAAVFHQPTIFVNTTKVAFYCAYSPRGITGNATGIISPMTYGPGNWNLKFYIGVA